MPLVVVAGTQYLEVSVLNQLDGGKDSLTCGPPALRFLRSFMIGILAFHGIGMRGSLRRGRHGSDNKKKAHSEGIESE